MSAASALVAAADRALGAVAGAKAVVSIESEHGASQWEVEVVTGDGTEYEVVLSGDGSTILRGPTAKADTAAERSRRLALVASVELDHRAAVDAVLVALPGGRIDDIELGTERGRVVWEADVYDSTGVKHEIDVDAVTGTATGR